MADLGSIADLLEDGEGLISLFTPRGQFRADTGTISGTVLDGSGNPAARVVAAVRRSDGLQVAATVSNGTTGDYSMQVAPGVEYAVICLDDAAGSTYNDLILRTTPT